MIAELGVAIFKTVGGLLGDALGLLTRPVVFLGYFGLAPDGLVEAFSTARILNGFVGTVSVVLLGISVATICKRDAGLKLVALFFAVPLVGDAVMQMPGLFALIVEQPAGQASAYPPSQTGAFALPQMIYGTAAVAFVFSERLSQKIVSCVLSAWFLKLSNAVWLRCMATRFQGEHNPIPAIVFNGASAVSLVSVIVPDKAWQVLFGYFSAALKLINRALAMVYEAVTFGLEAMERLWQIVKDVVWSLIQLPLVAQLHRILIAPLWMLLTPWLLPLWTSAVAYSCSLGASTALSGSELLLGVALSSAGLVALASSTVLALDAVVRCSGGLLDDPLQWRAVRNALQLQARAVSTPWMVCAAAARWLNRLVWPLLGRVVCWLAALFTFAYQYPPLGIAGVVAVNFALFTSSFPLIPLLDAALAGGGSALFTAGERLMRVLELPARGARADAAVTDMVLALALVTICQVAAFRIAWCLLFRLQISAEAQGRQGAGEPSGAEANSIAEGLSDPRQCGLCCFGPVDYGGCSNLRTHHGERGTSNCCPRCGWFAASLDLWPRWDFALRAQGWSTLRKVTWHEVNMVHRAAAKALLVPFAILFISRRLLHLPPSPSAFLALGYLVPWAGVNWTALSEMHSIGQRRPQPGSLPTRAASHDLVDDSSCGAPRRAEELGKVTASAALEAILSNVPHRVFLGDGDLCPVCIEPFAPEAADVAASLEGAEAAAALRKQDPPTVALRCGHALHVSCAEACVANARNQHVRCPLCREPATLLAAAGARLFT